MVLPRHQRPARNPGFLFGACYYPEHWDEAQRQTDPARMAAAGINVVRMAEFAWNLIEPSPGHYDFSLFDKTIGRLAECGIRTVLCTPTAAPPRWLTIRHPDWMRKDRNGREMAHGSRQHCCTTNADFRAASVEITRAMSQHFSGNPNVIGWQIDNEFHCHFDECFCPACTAGFQRWLHEKYKEIDSLNAEWGTSFWAQSYSRFAEIPLPANDRPTHPNPGHQLDWFRFLSDATIKFQHDQVEVLRAAQPGWWITHNGMFKHIDYWRFSEDLDFLGIDVYPGFAPDQPIWSAIKYEECRAASGSFIVPEQQAGPGGQRPYFHKNPQPGQMRLWAWQAVANGADGVLHFRWRTCRFGAEIYWCGILDHDDVARRRYDEVAGEGAEFLRLGAEIVGTTKHVRAAILVEHDQDEAYATMPLGLPGPDQQRKLVFGELWRRHLPVGFVDARDDFEGLDLIILPSFALTDVDQATRLRAFVQGGGTCVATARTATRDRSNQVLAKTPPGPLSTLFGITMEEFGKLDAGELTLQTRNGSAIPSGEGYEILIPTDAEIIARWKESPGHASASRPGISINRIGQGKAIYIGTWLTEENATALVDLILGFCPLSPLAQADPIVEVTQRQAKDHALTFLLNHGETAQTISSLPRGTEIISEQRVASSLELLGYGVAVIRHERSNPA